VNLYRSKTDSQLRYIMADAAEAAVAMQGMDGKAEAKYLDQMNDAASELARRKQATRARRLCSAAPDLLDALRMARAHVLAAAEADVAFERQQQERGMHGSAAECRKAHDMRMAALAVIDATISAATSEV